MIDKLRFWVLARVCAWRGHDWTVTGPGIVSCRRCDAYIYASLRD